MSICTGKNTLVKSRLKSALSGLYTHVYQPKQQSVQQRLNQRAQLSSHPHLQSCLLARNCVGDTVLL